MNWNKAKNLILFALIALNIILYCLINITHTKYVLSTSQLENITGALSVSHIGVYGELPKNFEPIRELNVTNVSSELSSQLVALFFKNEISTPRPIVENDKTTYTTSNKVLILQNGSFTLLTPKGLIIDGNSTVNQDFIMKSFGANFKDFYLYNKTTSSTDGTTYEYREKYKGNIIYSNYVEIKVNSDKKITMIDGYYSKPSNFTGSKKDIVSVDMALFKLDNSIPKNDNNPIFIDDVKLVYYQDEPNSQPGTVLKASPYYLITIKGNNIPFLINAYSNVLINGIGA